VVQGYSKQLKSILRDHGWAYLRPGKGDHEIWAKGSAKPVVVDNKIMSRHTANAVLKQAAIAIKF
jgi:predicted RNA binding protein YcfA (HicA-like mRNA interferase family)